MKHLLSLLSISLAAFGGASTDNARIYTFDSEQSLSPFHQVSPTAAKLILGRRLGSSQDSLLGPVDGQMVQYLNEFGGRQSTLLGSLSEPDDITRLLVVWAGAITKGNSMSSMN